MDKGRERIKEKINTEGDQTDVFTQGNARSVDKKRIEIAKNIAGN